MGKRGFPKQPKEVALMKGTFRDDRYPETDKPELQYLNYVPTAPATLDDNGAKFWDEMLRELIKIKNLMAFHYLTNFELMCYNYQVILAAREELKEGLKILDSKTGNMVINPSWKVFNEAYKNFVNMSREFGCTASAMDRLNLGSANKKDKETFSDFTL